MLSFLINIMGHSFLLVFLGTVLLMIAVFMPKKHKGFKIVAGIVLWLVILNIFFGARLSNWAIYKHGENGSGVVLSQQETGDLYNSEPIVEYEVLLKQANGQTLETSFQSWDFNVYPRPEEGRYNYPEVGVEFAVKYLPQNPDLFVILAEEGSDYFNASNCQMLEKAVEEAETKMNFAKEDEAYKGEYEAVLKVYQESDCDEGTGKSIEEGQEKMKETSSLNWQFYWNDTYDFAFSMPQNWQIDPKRTQPDSVVFKDPIQNFPESREAVNFEANPDKLSFQAFVNQYIAQREYPEEQVNRNYPIQIGGQPTVFIDTHEFGIKLYLFEHNGQIFRIESQSLFTDEVLKTINFDGSVGEACATKHINEVGDVYYSVYDECYWQKHGPMDFLEDLKAHPSDQMTIMEAPKGWITKEDVAKLMLLIDSTEPAALVFAAYSSSGAVGRTSTVGNEAMFLIEGYRKGAYPPFQTSTDQGTREESFLFKADREAMKNWWEEEQKTDVKN